MIEGGAEDDERAPDAEGGGDPLASLLVFAQGTGGSDKFDETSWDEQGVLKLHVIKDILVVGGTFPLDCGRVCEDVIPGLATISLIIERFEVDNPPVSEPLTGSLLGFGLMGLWRFGRRRADA